MKPVASLSLAFALTVAPAVLTAKVRATARKPGPVVVELFTAQGCGASCKDADALAKDLAARPGLVVLTWSVDYWDYLGWKDSFAQPAFTARQKAYARRLGPRDVYTPQIIINGAAQTSGADADKVDEALDKAKPLRSGRPRLKVSRGRLHVGGGDAGRGVEVWLVRYDPAEREVEVKAGDNRGQTLSLTHVVRQAVKLGDWKGAQKTWTLPSAPQTGLGGVILLQAPRGGPLLEVLNLPAPPKAAAAATGGAAIKRAPSPKTSAPMREP